MNPVVLVLGAVVIGMFLQVYTTYKQTKAFGAAVREIRKHGNMSIGATGKRYRGGKAFVAIAADADGRITKAISLTGWTTLARPKELPSVKGLTLARLRGNGSVPSIDPRVRGALQNAAETLNKHLAKAG